MTRELSKNIAADHMAEEDLVFQVRKILLPSPGSFPRTAEIAERLHIS
jgi:hypothetical protein